MVNSIEEWRESFLALSDDYFFKLVRLYIGELKTPYNKNKIILQMEGMLRQNENIKNIISLLSDFDIKVLTAIKFIPDATVEKIQQLFQYDYSPDVIRTEMMQLKARLLIYVTSSGIKGTELFHINPILKIHLEQFLQISKLIPECNERGLLHMENSPVTAELIAAFLSFITLNPDMIKNDGSLKKRAQQELEEKFHSRVEQVKIIFKAFRNLFILKETEKGFYIDWEKAGLFSQMTQNAQYAYILAAANMRLGRSMTRKCAEIFLKCTRTIPDNGFTTRSLLKFAYIISARPQEEEAVFARPGQSKFAMILAQGEKRLQMEERGTEDDTEITNSSIQTISSVIESMLEDAVTLGLLTAYDVPYGKQNVQQDSYELILSRRNAVVKYDDLILTASSVLKGGNRQIQNTAVLNIDSAYKATLLPGLTLNQLLPLMRFMDIVRFDSAAEFEISKDSIQRGFNSGFSSKDIYNFISDYSPFKIPQGMEFAIDEWERSYQSAMLYKGYVLRLQPEKIVLVKNNPAISTHIIKELAEGVYFMDFSTDREATEILQKAGLESVSKVNQAPSENKQLPFLSINETPSRLLESGKKSFMPQENPVYSLSSFNEQKEKRQKLFDKIECLDISEEEKESLTGLVTAKIIFNPEQLGAHTLMTEITTAENTDYNGKLRLIEQAIKNNEQIIFSTISNPEKMTGHPLKIFHSELADGGFLLVNIENQEQEFPIGKISFVHRIKNWDFL